MSIRDLEDKLFSKWKTKPDRIPFVLDGAPVPEDYLKTQLKIAFVLKDANLGDYKESEFDLREHLKRNPHKWWNLVSNWCYLLHTLHREELDWDQIDSLGITSNVLNQFVFIQLKKRSGHGSISNSELKKYAREDKTEIIEQLRIYKPQIIVCAGVGEFVAEILNCTNFRKTSRGIGYWTGKIDESETFLVDYCHPSVRAGKKVASAIAYGLRDACYQISVEHDLITDKKQKNA